LAPDDGDRGSAGAGVLSGGAPRLVDALFTQQLDAWPRLRQGVLGLEASETRPVRVGGFEVLVRHIPHRVASTTAAVDPASVEKRPCFLCPENLDPEEEGIPFGSDFTIYCNPFPIVARHLTIVHREHRPQRIAGRLDALLDLAAALPGFFVAYNGAECGASAPDHMHFQAGSRDVFPVERDAAGRSGPSIAGYARKVLLFRGRDRARLAGELSRALEVLSSVTGREPEPWLNIAAFHEEGAGWAVFLFPRGKHRPAAFATGELTVSPAAIDLCGILVVPLAKDFARISGEDVASVFREVTLPDGPFFDVLARLGSAP
jgi:hypothetical protein